MSLYMIILFSDVSQIWLQSHCTALPGINHEKLQIHFEWLCTVDTICITAITGCKQMGNDIHNMDICLINIIWSLSWVIVLV